MLANSNAMQQHARATHGLRSLELALVRSPVLNSLWWSRIAEHLSDNRRPSCRTFFFIFEQGSTCIIFVSLVGIFNIITSDTWSR